MRVGYQVARVGGGWSRVFSRRASVHRLLRRRLGRIDGPYSLKNPGDDWGNDHGLGDVLNVIDEKLKRDAPFKFFVRGSNANQHRYAVRKVLRLRGSDFIQALLTQIGVPYIWGDADPKGGGSSGFDCSGLMLWGLEQVGVSGFPHQSGAQLGACDHRFTNHDKALPGDLMGFSFGRLGPGVIDHVGAFMGGDRLVDTEDPSRPVAVRAVPWGAFVEFGRIERVNGPL